jgi:hypothetical protein
VKIDSEEHSMGDDKQTTPDKWEENQPEPTKRPDPQPDPDRENNNVG